MKNINVNELQNNISRVLKEVEGGEVFEVGRYSKPVAYLVSKDNYDKLMSGTNCQKCVEDLRSIKRYIKDERKQ